MSVTTDHLGKRNVPFEVIPHEQAYTTVEEARAIGIAADEVLKTLVLKTRTGYALAVVLGSGRLDKRHAEKAVGDRHAHLATEEEMREAFPGFELGAIPPLGSLLGIPMCVDPEVLKHETVAFAAGSQTESVKIRTEDLLRDEPHTVAKLTREGKD